jgi:hypothetical protein
MFHPSRRFSKFFDTEREPQAPLALFSLFSRPLWLNRGVALDRN